MPVSNIYTECLRRASRATSQQHMADLMHICRMLSWHMTETEIAQAKLNAEE